ncbi:MULTISPECIES: hypothetical protein [Bacillus cereus group]|uniref:hypothetical protein n=1 Tax=Bacillus cereus group TaxID=86661 RepID=UPI000BF319DE|nr:hypothetical protein [Bacillus thuringiensis]MBZ3766319.1 hypothetical protein [Bacillus cereus]PFK81854.1 hypothetical protein COJ04_30485 [Bacillus thuringiensis]PFP10251.1 hypothetical protein COJ91_05410 [Bacillus thuringiensis]PGP48134.1 hypothetical protein CN992_27985 [Bacillus thuringiensis]PGY60171.1 hypothetical protein COE24_08815 [Bacillus thuringiensis]
MGLSDRIWRTVVAFGIATNGVACIMAVYIQKYELMINYLTNILFLIIISLTFIKMKINKWVALGFTLVVIEKGIKAGYDFYTHDYYGVSWSLAIIVYCIYEMEKYHIEMNE